MRFIKICDKVNCQDCKDMILFDMPGRTPCSIYEEDDEDRARHREVEEFLREKSESEERAKECKLVFK
jgi:hypothetical protein